MFKQLTNDQLDALMGYADLHGRLWKSQLVYDWLHGRCHQAEMQQIRNQFGPRWLTKITYAGLETAYNKRFGLGPDNYDTE